MRPCGASTLVPLPSSVRANVSRAHAPECVEWTFRAISDIVWIDRLNIFS